jgi:hypothetical protein
VPKNIKPGSNADFLREHSGTEEQISYAFTIDAHNVRASDSYDLVPFDHPVGVVQWIFIDRVQANDYNPNSVAAQEMTLLHTSISEDGYCVEKSTPVLGADLIWRPAGELKAGDRIVAFDDEPTPNSTNTKHGRRFRTATVTSNHLEEDDLWEIETDRGVIQATGDHPWLGQHVRGDASKRTIRWITSMDLTSGDKLIHFGNAWETDRLWEAGWLSGFLDGEGTLSQNQRKGHAPHVRLAGYQRPSATADFMIAEMTKRVPLLKTFVAHKSDEGWSDMVMCRVDRLLDIMRLLGTVRPQRLLDLGQFWEGSSIALQDTRATVLSVKRVGRGEVARLSTSTGTFIADGYAVHNTQPVVALWDPDAGNDKTGRYIIIDGFHRYTTMKKFKDITDSTQGYLPVVVLDKAPADRIASTVRHNRARGKHSVAGMSKLVFDMLKEGVSDVDICAKLGLEAEELARLKHITGYSRLFKDATYSPVMVTQSQLTEKAKYKKEHPDEVVPRF